VGTQVIRRGLAILGVAGLITLGSPAMASAEPAEVRITGDVAVPAVVSADSLRQLPPRTIETTFESHSGTQHHTYVGPWLVDVLAQASPPVSDEHDRLGTVIVATGTDGYSVAVAWAEIAADFAASPVVVAYTEDGEELARPRLVVPGDIRGGRYVSDLAELRVVNLVS
jgi:hypothetical protein